MDNLYSRFTRTKYLCPTNVKIFARCSCASVKVFDSKQRSRIDFIHVEVPGACVFAEMYVDAQAVDVCNDVGSGSLLQLYR